MFLSNFDFDLIEESTFVGNELYPGITGSALYEQGVLKSPIGEHPYQYVPLNSSCPSITTNYHMDPYDTETMHASSICTTVYVSNFYCYAQICGIVDG